METFTYFMPTKVFFGRDCVSRQGQAMVSAGKRALVVTGKNSARKCGALDDITLCLKENGIGFDLFDEVEANPSIATARLAGKRARDFNADMIIAVGGGSPLDAGKAAALLALNDFTDDALFSADDTIPVLPVVAVPTTAGTGSEVTPYSILTDMNLQTKRNLRSEKLFPVLAYLDPRYTELLPRDITSYTAIDALTHAIEGYLSSRHTPLTDVLALESIRLLGENLPGLSGSLPDSAGREKLLMASLFAGIVIARTGTTILHAMGYHLTFFHKVEHGRANGFILPAYLEYVMNARPDRAGAILDAMGCRDINCLSKILGPLVGVAPCLSDVERRDYSLKACEAPSAASTVPRPGPADIRTMYEHLLSCTDTAVQSGGTCGDV